MAHAARKSCRRLHLFHASFSAKTANGTAHPTFICHYVRRADRPYLVYRLLYPGYELWSEMGIYQRDLTSYRQTPVVLENKDFGDQCINCHSFAQKRSDKGHDDPCARKAGRHSGQQTGKVEKFNSRVTGFRHGATYPQWNPDGRFLAFSANEASFQVFHSAGAKKIEVSDVGSDLMVYDSETYHAFSDRTISGTHYMETYPTWTPRRKPHIFLPHTGLRRNHSVRLYALRSMPHRL